MLLQIPVGILSIFLSHVLRLMHESTASIRANGCNSHMNDIQASFRPLPTYLHSSRPTCVRFSAYPYQIDLIISLPRAAAAEQSRYCSFPLSPDQKRKCRGNSSPSFLRPIRNTHADLKGVESPRLLERAAAGMNNKGTRVNRSPWKIRIHTRSNSGGRSKERGPAKGDARLLA